MWKEVQVYSIGSVSPCLESPAAQGSSSLALLVPEEEYVGL